MRYELARIASMRDPVAAQHFLLEDDPRGGDRIGYLTTERE